jgi:hypothetical protein
VTGRLHAVEKIANVEPGDIDLLSKAAYHARLATCTVIHPKNRSPCSRAVGHDENRPGHPASKHVATGLGFVALEVWT